MIDALATALIFDAIACALWAVVLIVINRRFAVNQTDGLALGGALTVLELGLLVQAVAGVVNMVGESRGIDRLAFVGYLFGPSLIVPMAAVWSIAERTRWGPGVLVIGCLAIPVMILRLRQIWDGHG